MSNPRRANGHRRDQLRARVLREETHCWLCGGEVDTSLGLMPGVHSPRCAKPECRGCVPHPLSPEVDEIVPVSLGGDPLARDNCRLAHRQPPLQREARQRDGAGVGHPKVWIVGPQRAAATRAPDLRHLADLVTPRKKKPLPLPSPVQRGGCQQPRGALPQPIPRLTGRHDQ